MKLKYKQIYKDIIKQQAATNQALLKQQTESFKGITGKFIVNINQSTDTKCNAVSNEVVSLAKEINDLLKL